MSDESRSFSRRRVLQVLGMAPLAGALGMAEAQQTVPKQGHSMPNQPAADTKQPATGAPKRKFLNAREWRIVSVLADDIIPRDDRSGSATDAGVPAYIDFHMSVPETDESSRVAMRGGLRWVDTESRRRFGVGYASASSTQRHELLDTIAWPDKATPNTRYGVTFFNRFRDMVASGFFSSQIGWKDLRYEGNVFNPNWQGCPEPAMKKLGVSHALMDTRIKPQ
jgi:hypothetical protein